MKAKFQFYLKKQYELKSTLCHDLAIETRKKLQVISEKFSELGA